LYFLIYTHHMNSMNSMNNFMTRIDSVSEMKMDELNMNHELSSKKMNMISKDVIQQYKFKYPTTFAELKLDGFTDSDAVRYIRNNIEFDTHWVGYGGKDEDYIPGSSMTVMKLLGCTK